MRRPFVVGICGGIGSGKSAVARIFERLGAHVLDADRVAHEVLTEPAVRDRVRARFGGGVFARGEVDRGALAGMVFGDSPAHAANLADLEAIVHPRILARMRGELAGFRGSPSPPPIVVIDAPLLTESPLLADCDEVVFVDAPETARLARTRADRRWNAAHHRARELAQPPVAARRKAATAVIDNSGTPEDLERACLALFRRWAESR
jgi:dephospho-CoA kinase